MCYSFHQLQHLRHLLVSQWQRKPAAVCLLEEEREDKWVQDIATEFNLSETCYLTPIAELERSDISLTDRFRLRWFTPTTEVELCGHATLASAHVLFSSGLVKSNIIEFVDSVWSSDCQKGLRDE